MKKKKISPIRIAVLLSLFLHFLFILLITKTSFERRMTLTPPEKKYVKISLVDKKEITEYKNKIQITQENTPQLEKKKDSQKKQIVNNENNGQELPPTNSRFLGEKNQLFTQQSLAKNVDIFNAAGKGIKAGYLAEQKKVVEEISTPVDTNTNTSVDKQLVEHSPTTPPLPTTELSALGIHKNKDYQENLKKNLLAQLSPKKSPSQKQLPQQLQDVPPEEDLTEKNTLGIESGDKSTKGLASNNDFIEDIPLGDVTNLNTTEFKFYGFYARIRSQLEQHWGLSLKQKIDQLSRGGRKLLPGKNYVTALKVTIDQKGNITNIVLAGPSGLNSLDDAAIESFNRAGPFPNPPKEMVQKGPATLEWGFVVKS
ncbi:MAG: energy transducer TonB [Oligoflexia bacterium]|nr:energy transducer TonB [Oligoflexia bacterium]